MPDEEEPEKYHSIVVFLDDFSHMRPNDKEMGDAGEASADEDDSAPKIVPLYSETDDEKQDGDEQEAVAEEDSGNDRPAMYNCVGGQCGGMENDIDNAECVFCCAARPPMDELIAAHKAKMKAEKAEAKAVAAANADSDAEEGEPLHHIRLKKLKRDIRHVISHDQRLIALQRLEEAKKAKEDGQDGGAEEAKKEGEAAKEEEKAPADDSDASPDEEIFDLENLPEDLHERLRLLGMDEALLEEGGDWLADMEPSLLEEKTKEVARQKEEQAARRKRRKAKEEARKVAALKGAGSAEEIFKL